MKLSELPGEYARRKIITYAQDHNTAIEKNKDLQQIQGRLYKGKNDTDHYGQVTCRLYVYYEDLNIGIDIGAIYYPDEKTADEIVPKMSASLLQGPGAFIEELDHAVLAVQRITNAEIALARHIAPDKVPTYIAARQRRRDMDDERQAAERAKQADADAAYCEERNAETQRILDAALQTLQSGGILRNDSITFYHSRYDCRSYSIINHLARQYGVEFPLKVQGWINKRLTQVSIQDGRINAYWCKGGKSNTFMDYMNKLLGVILQGEVNGGAA